MRTVWGVLALVIVATAATVAVGIGIPSSAPRLPGPVTVPAGHVDRSPAATPARAASEGTSGGGQPVEVVTPDHPVASLPAPIGSDSREAEQLNPAVRPAATTPSVPPATDR